MGIAKGKKIGKTSVSMDLPKVGDRLMRVLTATKECLYPTFIPKECVVTYVNEAHGWYEVEFTDSHVRECYGLPVVDHSIMSGTSGAIAIMCVETGDVYSSINACARDMHLYTGDIYRQLFGQRESYRGYHFMPVL